MATLMAEHVASYRLNGHSVDVWQGDALTMPAGVVLLGRARSLRSQLEAMTGGRFEPADRPTIHGRKFEFLSMGAATQPPWRLAVSLDYRPRNVRVDARQTSPNLTHVDKLSDDISWVIDDALRRTQTTQPEPLMLLPLSCRNPEVVAVAQVLAVWSIIVDWLPVSRRKAPSVFRFADSNDVSPFVDALENRDDVITRTLRASAPYALAEGALERWFDHRFDRI